MLHIFQMSARTGPSCTIPTDAVIHGRFNPNCYQISRVHANANLEFGESHYSSQHWNPTFGQMSRYTLCKWIGRGRYSDVFLSLQDNLRQCAVKLLKPVNPDRVRRELKLISVLHGHPNVLELWDIVFDGRTQIPAIVTKFVPNSPCRTLITHFTLSETRFYIYRLLSALAHTHRHGVMHRDVKPLNILCSNPRQEVVLADWGLGEFYHPLKEYSLNICTLFYKSPELIFGYKLYDYAIDVWAAGVVFLEALAGKYHVFDVETVGELIQEVAKIVGGQAIIVWSAKYKCRLQAQLIDQISRFTKTSFDRLIPNQRLSFKDPVALDLLERMLTVDHKERITAEEALAHPFFEEVRDYDATRNHA
jgi:casein kinase II subunit alpha